MNICILGDYVFRYMDVSMIYRSYGANLYYIIAL